jgi:hypothetical protein
MWSIFDDPRFGGQTRNTDLTTPSYNQALQAMAKPGMSALVMGLEMSGATCGQSVTSWEKNWTRWSLEQLATDTGATVGGVPAVYSVQQDGTAGPASGSDPGCPTATNLGAIVSNAVTNLTANLAQPITAIAVDDDDLTDFDGTTGVNAGSLVLTPQNIDDATFVSSFAAQPATGCSGPSGNTYAACGAGAQPNFTVNFKIPPTVSLRANPQIFHFHIVLMGENATVLGSTPVTLVVPPSPYSPQSVARDYDGSSSCPEGYAPLWEKFTWDATVPASTSIQFFASEATTLAALDSGSDLMPVFATATPSMASGSADLGQYLKSLGLNPDAPFVRIHAVINPDPTAGTSPTLADFDLHMNCSATQ